MNFFNNIPNYYNMKFYYEKCQQKNYFIIKKSSKIEILILIFWIIIKL